MDAGIYLVCVVCIYMSFIDHIEKYRLTMKNAHDIARDAIGYIKDEQK